MQYKFKGWKICHEKIVQKKLQITRLYSSFSVDTTITLLVYLPVKDDLTPAPWFTNQNSEILAIMLPYGLTIATRSLSCHKNLI